MWTPRYSVKRTDFVVPLVPGLYKIHSIMRTLAGLLHKTVQHRWLIHQLDILLTLVCIVLTSGYPFFAIVQQGRALEWRLRSIQRHEYALPRLLEIYRKPPK